MGMDFNLVDFRCYSHCDRKPQVVLREGMTYLSFLLDSKDIYYPVSGRITFGATICLQNGLEWIGKREFQLRKEP